jgi:hypothetical protein
MDPNQVSETDDDRLKEHRKRQNQSARKCRAKKKADMEAMHGRVGALNEENLRLRQAIFFKDRILEMLQKDNILLKTELEIVKKDRFRSTDNDGWRLDSKFTLYPSIISFPYNLHQFIAHQSFPPTDQGSGKTPQFESVNPYFTAQLQSSLSTLDQTSNIEQIKPSANTKCAANAEANEIKLYRLNAKLKKYRRNAKHASDKTSDGGNNDTDDKLSQTCIEQEQSGASYTSVSCHTLFKLAPTNSAATREYDSSSSQKLDFSV